MADGSRQSSVVSNVGLEGGTAAVEQLPDVRQIRTGHDILLRRYRKDSEAAGLRYRCFRGMW